ncbi:hypothetical protein M408DRAFT_27241 [Serendipita vermifera MAFF 305830]|uniref:Uncharacterized protein n=1 Tax=Serendipita vermifera MAFF 305830 TaxID=933852 RepID=A0A0C3AY38_SERVB|nr:hypothetical protein M408DRAFT_27241 [Serendipita vermifera MAFF 305830]
MSSRTFSPAQNPNDGLGPLRTARSRPGRHIQSSPARVAGINLLDEGNAVGAIGFARQHRRTASAPANTQSPFATPKRHGTLPWHADRAETTDSYSGAPSAPIASSTRPPPVSFRQSLQSLLRTPRRSSTDTPRTSYRARYTYTDDEADNSDGSRFDLLSSDPFRSDSPIIQDIEDLPGPPVPPKSPVHANDKLPESNQPTPSISLSQLVLESPVHKPLELGTYSRTGPPRTLHIIPPSQLAVLEEIQSPVLETTSTPASPVAAMRSAFNRMTNSATTGRSRIRLLSFIKEVKSPLTATSYDEEAEGSGHADAPKLNLHDFQADGPLFDPSSFQLPEIPLPKAKIRVEGPTLGHPAPPPAPPIQHEEPPSLLATHIAPSALQLHLHGDGDFEGYVIASPVESLRVPTPPAPAPPPLPTVKTPTEPPAWIRQFREELEELAGQALSLTSLGSRLVLELPQEDHGVRRTLIFQEESSPEMTPGLTFDSVSVSSFRKTPKKPTRPVPPTPGMVIPEESGGDPQLTDYSAWTPQDTRVSLYTIKSTSTWDPTQSFPSIPSDYSGDETDDDDISFKTAQPPEPHVFQPAIDKREAIEEAIRKIQRKAELERISVIEEEQEDTNSEHTIEPPPPTISKTSVPALFRNASNPFASPFDDRSSRSSTEQPKRHRKVSVLRKRVLSRNSGSSSKSDSGHSRSYSEPLSPPPEDRRIVIAGRLPLTSRSTSEHGHDGERSLPSLPRPPLISAKPRTPVTPQPTRDYLGHPIYLQASTPTFEVIPQSIFGDREHPDIYYPVDPIPLTYHNVKSQRSSDIFVEL